MSETHEKYSVLMSLYWREKPEYLRESLDSIIMQTVKPDEIVVVKDGPLGDSLEDVLSEYMEKYPGLFVIVARPNNGGFGVALRDGVLACKNEWIARMDTDDIADLRRMEIQLDVIREHPEYDIVGSVYYEFDGDFSHLILRDSPEKNEHLIRFMHKRNPFGHDSLLLRKSKVLEAGNYRSELRFEDYSLWIRMVLKKAKMYNIQTPLLYVRGNKDYYSRRGGFQYMKQNVQFFDEFRKAGFFTRRDCVLSLVPRCMVCLLPNRMRTWVYVNLLRTKVAR